MKKITAILLVLCLLLFTGCDLPAINFSRNSSSPEDDFGAFIGCLSAGNYDQCSDYIYNYASLGMSSFDDPTYELMLDSLNRSRTYSVTGCTVRGRDAVLDIDFTTLDFKKLGKELSSSTVALVDEKQFDSGATFSDEEIMSVMTENLQSLVQSPDAFCTTKSFSLEMRYVDGMWKLICSDEFYSALIGYIV